MTFSPMRFMPLLAAIVPGFAQASISASPLSSLPVNSPLMLLALLLGVGTIAWWGLRRAGVRNLHSALAPLVLLAGAGWLTISGELGAQLLVTFTDPEGQTLMLPYTEEECPLYEVTNSAGVRLRITEFTMPPSCDDVVVPPGKSGVTSMTKTDSAPRCEIGSVLGVNQSCILYFGFGISFSEAAAKALPNRM